MLREQRRLRSLSRFVDLDAARRRRLDTVDRLARGLADAAKALLLTFMPRPDGDAARAAASAAAADARVPVRNAAVKGPLAPGGDWVTEKAGAAAARSRSRALPNSDDVTYEIVNFVDGVRTVSEIRDAVSAEFEPIDLAAVAEYLDLLAKAGAISFRR